MLLIEKIAEENIQEAIQKGEFNNLALKGQPYRFDGYLYENPGSRIQFKLLRDHNLLPRPLEIKKQIDDRKDTLSELIGKFEPVYLSKLKQILDILELNPGYPLSNCAAYPTRHQIFMSRSLPLIIRSRPSSTLRLETVLFNRAVHRKRDQYFKILNSVLELIGEYNREITKATLKRRDIFRNFTGMGWRWVQREKEGFDRRFRDIALTEKQMN